MASLVRILPHQLLDQTRVATLHLSDHPGVLDEQRQGGTVYLSGQRGHLIGRELIEEVLKGDVIGRCHDLLEHGSPTGGVEAEEGVDEGTNHPLQAGRVSPCHLLVGGAIGLLLAARLIVSWLALQSVVNDQLAKGADEL